MIHANNLTRSSDNKQHYFNKNEIGKVTYHLSYDFSWIASMYKCYSIAIHIISRIFINTSNIDFNEKYVLQHVYLYI